MSSGDALRDADHWTDLTAALDGDVWTAIGAVGDPIVHEVAADPTWLDRRLIADDAVAAARAAIDSGDPDRDVVRHLRVALDALGGTA